MLKYGDAVEISEGEKIYLGTGKEKTAAKTKI